MKSEETEALRRAHLFKGLSDDVLQNITGNEPVRLYPKGKILFQQGEEADHFYVILTGWVKLYRQLPSGDEAILHIFTTGDTFAEAAMFGDHKYPATAEIVSESRVLAINCNRFERILRETPNVAMRMLASTSHHLKDLVTEIEQIKGRNSFQRLAYFLVKMCPPNATSAVVKLPYEKSLIASKLAIQPESLSRSLNKMRGLGVKCVNDQIIISDVDALREIAMDDDVEDRDQAQL